MPRHDDDDLRIEMEGGTTRKILKQLLGVWAIGYPIVSILPLLSTSGNGAGGVAVGGIASLIVAGALFGPWIVGIIILGVLVLVSPAPTPVIRRGPALRQCPNCGGRIDPRRTWLCDQCGEPFAKEPPRRSLMDQLSSLGHLDRPEAPEHGKIGPQHWDKNLRRWVP